MEEQADIVLTATSNVENNITPTITQIQSNASNALNTANTANNTANTAKSIAEGANQALSYTNYQAMITAFNELADNVYKVGQNIMIITLNVPDLWISAIENTSITYNYTNDEAITTALSTNGYIQVGYYKLSALETQKVDLTDYYTKTGTENKIEDYLYQIMPTDSTSGVIATIDDATTMFNAVDVTGSIEPVQDLNGQENPYPAGGGKNLLNANADTGSSNSVTYTKNEDGTYTVNGTADGTSSFVAGTIELTANTQYVISGCPSGGSESSYNVRIRDANYTALGFDAGSGATITPTETKTYYYQITVVSGYSVSNLVFKPMVCLSTASNPDYAHFAPYSNVCPITGFTGVNVSRTGKNLIPNLKTQDTSVRVRLGESSVGDGAFYKAGTYKVSWGLATAQTVGIYWRTFKNGENGPVVNSNTIVITEDVNVKIWLYASGGISVDNVLWWQVELGSTATPYEPYTAQTIPIDWQSTAGTVYGGSLDVTTGLLTVNRAELVFDGDESWQYYSVLQGNLFRAVGQPTPAIIANNVSDFLCDAYKPVTARTNGTLSSSSAGYLDFIDNGFNALDGWTAHVSQNNIHVVYPLAEPVTYQLTPQEVSFLLGTNNLWVDTGDINVTYKADIQKYIDKKTN